MVNVFILNECSESRLTACLPYMAACSARTLDEDIEKVSSLSESAVEDPDAAQKLTILIKNLLKYKVCAQ